MTILLDCTPRDGGYYNEWDFSPELIEDYLLAMKAVGVNYVELGLRSLRNEGYKGPNAFTTDSYLRSLNIPDGLSIAVMVNASELVGELSLERSLERLFPEAESMSLVKLVRIACHIHEFEKALPAASWLKERGFVVGFNLMQIADRSQEEVEAIAMQAANYPVDVLYFADSMGSMDPEDVARIISWLKEGWNGPLGIHAHDNLGLALQNSLRALNCGVSWVDSTITGMGRGPGNVKTEQLAIEVAELCGKDCNLVPLMGVINRFFKPMQAECGWGTNPYYYLAGKYGIHPTYVQEMLSDSRYNEEDILAVIERLRVEGGKKFSLNILDAARNFYQGRGVGKWSPIELMEGREVLLLGTGPGVSIHKQELESYIGKYKPLVMALNTQEAIAADLIEVRVACHPVRLLADCGAHARLPQPLITPASMLPEDVRESLKGKEIYDFGLNVEVDTFRFEATHCTLPSSLVIAFALAVAASGKVRRILMAGFDGYGEDDPRNREMNKLLRLYQEQACSCPLVAVTPTRYELEMQSIYGLTR